MAERMVTVLHVVAGTLVLFVAPAALLVRKGGVWHRRWGFTFAGAMALVILSAAVMWIPHGHLFLLFLDVVSAYLVFAGLRVVLRRRRRVPSVVANRVDLAAAGAVCASALVLIAIAVRADTPLLRGLAPVLLALGAVAVAFAALDYRGIARGVPARLGSLLFHLSAMIGAYISAVTAFCVINVHGVPMTQRWLVPSLAGSLVIAAFSVAYRRRFARRDERRHDRAFRDGDSERRSAVAENVTRTQARIPRA